MGILVSINRAVMLGGFMRFKKLLISFSILSVLTMSKCGLPPEFADFRGLTPEQEHEKFKTLPIDKKVGFHLVKMRFHPPVLSFAYDIADEGEKNLPYLLERLEREHDDMRKHHIIVIFGAIQTISVDLRIRDDIMGRLQTVVDHMREPIWKEMSEQSLQDIKSTTPKYALDKTK